MKVMQTDLHEEGAELLLRDARLGRQLLHNRAKDTSQTSSRTFRPFLLGPTWKKKESGIKLLVCRGFHKQQEISRGKKMNKDRSEKNNEGAPVGGL